MDDTGVEQACKAFFKNDPFYPRPGSGRVADDRLWNVFKQRFMSTSRIILEQKNIDDVSLAEKLVQRIEEEGVARSRNKEGLA